MIKLKISYSAKNSEDCYQVGTIETTLESKPFKELINDIHNELEDEIDLLGNIKMLNFEIKAFDTHTFPITDSLNTDSPITDLLNTNH